MSSQGSPFYHSLKSTPRLSDACFVTYAANDDATGAFTVRLQDLADGCHGAVMPFRHPEFLRQACCKLADFTGKDRYLTMAKQFELQDHFAIIRNLRLQLKFNLVLLRKNKSTFVLAEKDQHFLNIICDLKESARTLHVDISGYLDESYDDLDIAGCDNDFCLNQLDTPCQAGDLVTILLDADDQDHVLLIVRGNAPGKTQIALPGGFKEGKESASELCKREAHEETGYVANGASTHYFDLDQVVSKTWDPRPRFARYGMINDGLLRFDIVAGDLQSPAPPGFPPMY
jgi:hypothetical protein